MNKQARGVFICPSCGGPSAVTEEGDAACSQCGERFQIPKQVSDKMAAVNMGSLPEAGQGAIQRNVALKPKGAMTEFSQVEKVAEPVEARGDFAQLQKERKERRRKLKKRSKPPLSFYLKWFFVWVGVVGAILATVSITQDLFQEKRKSNLTVVGRLVGEEKEFYEREFPRIRSHFETYHVARTASQKAELALATKQLERKMRSHYSSSSQRRPNMALRDDPVFWNVAYEESPGFVEVAWDGKTEEDFEAVFVKVNDSWVLDWEHYVRFSSERWTLFHQQIGSVREGVFRVYIERVSESDDTAVKPWIKVRLLPPYKKPSRRRVEASEAIVLDLGAEVADKVERLFVPRTGESEGFSKLWKRDPDELRRATLALSWQINEQTGEEKIVIDDVLSGHWRALGKDLASLKGQAVEKESKKDE